MADIDDTLQLLQTADSELDEARQAIRAASQNAEETRDAFAGMGATGVAQLMNACQEAIDTAVATCETVTKSLEEAASLAAQAKEAGG